MSPALSDEQVLVLQTASAVIADKAKVLSDVELETLAAAGRLLLHHGRLAPITKGQWRVICNAVATMLGPALSRPARALQLTAA